MIWNGLALKIDYLSYRSYRGYPRYDNKKKLSNDTKEEITHWMPLPKPPKE